MNENVSPLTKAGTYKPGSGSSFLSSNETVSRTFVLPNVPATLRRKNQLTNATSWDTLIVHPSSKLWAFY